MTKELKFEVKINSKQSALFLTKEDATIFAKAIFKKAKKKAQKIKYTIIDVESSTTLEKGIWTPEQEVK